MFAVFLISQEAAVSVCESSNRKLSTNLCSGEAVEAVIGQFFACLFLQQVESRPERHKATHSRH